VTFWPDEDAYREQLEIERAEDLDEEQQRLDEERRATRAAEERQEGEPQ
jgi:hypothetical protein